MVWLGIQWHYFNTLDVIAFRLCLYYFFLIEMNELQLILNLMLSVSFLYSFVKC